MAVRGKERVSGILVNDRTIEDPPILPTRPKLRVGLALEGFMGEHIKEPRAISLLHLKLQEGVRRC